MTTPHLTSLIVTTDFGAPRAGVRERRSTSGGAFGDFQATREINTPSFSLPVVRELPPRLVRSIATW